MNLIKYCVYLTYKCFLFNNFLNNMLDFAAINFEAKKKSINQLIFCLLNFMVVKKTFFWIIKTITDIVSITSEYIFICSIYNSNF